jgi:hypothetical protein
MLESAILVFGSAGGRGVGDRGLAPPPPPCLSLLAKGKLKGVVETLNKSRLLHVTSQYERHRQAWSIYTTKYIRISVPEVEGGVNCCLCGH